MHVSKSAILQSVGEFAPNHVTRLAKSKKAAAVADAQPQTESLEA